MQFLFLTPVTRIIHYSKMNRYAGYPGIAEPNFEQQNWLRDLVVAGGKVNSHEFSGLMCTKTTQFHFKLSYIPPCN